MAKVTTKNLGLAVFVFILALTMTATVLASSAVCATMPRLPMLKMLSTSDCPACTQMAKTLDEINKKYRGKLATERVNLEQHQDVAREYNVRYVPTLIFLDSNGQKIAQKVGYMTLNEVLAVFRNAGVKI